MKITEVIEVLQSKLKAHGDVTVLVPTDQEVTGEPTGEVVTVTSWVDPTTNKCDSVMLADKWTADQLADGTLDEVPTEEHVQAEVGA